MGQINPRFSFLLTIKFIKMASNKQLDSRKLKTLLEVNVILKIYPKIKERKLISENLIRTLKSLIGI